MPSPRILHSFGQPGAGEGWYVVNDGVMGGVSESSVSFSGGALLFSGNVSLENNGGFASLRGPRAAYDTADATAITLRVKGDGRRYGVNVWTHDQWDGVYYQAKIEPPAGDWTEIHLPLEEFRPVWRGRVMPGEGPLDPARVRGFGMIIADKQEGPFRLEIATIGVVSNDQVADGG